MPYSYVKKLKRLPFIYKNLLQSLGNIETQVCVNIMVASGGMNLYCDL
jgi:hypothetical protein